MQITVSVIVPMYNVARWLTRCLDSLAAQTLHGMEVLLVDDASTDATVAIATRYTQQYPELFRLICQPRNQGSGMTRNTGLAAARGAYVGFVDADDTVQPQMFQKLYDAAQSTDASLVVCGLRQLFAHATEIIIPDTAYDADALLTQGAFLCSPCNKLYTRDFLTTHALVFPHSSMSEDMAFVFKVLVNKPQITYVHEALYEYYKHTQNITLDITRRADSVRSVADVRAYLHTHGKYRAFRKHYYRIAFLHLIYYPLCLICIDSLLKGNKRWHTVRHAPGYFYALLRFLWRGKYE